MPQSPRMTLRFFGAGGAFSRRYGTTCSMITLRSGDRWLVDCGRQAPDQIWDFGLTWHQIQGQIVTHVHGDHIFGLEDFAFMRFYESHSGVDPVMLGGPRPKFIAHSAVEAEVWETLGPSLRYVAGESSPRSGTLENYFEVIRASNSEPPRKNPWRHSESFEAEGLQLTARECEHVPGKPSCSLEIRVAPGTDDERIAWWSGDCTVDQLFLESIESKTTVYFHDCTFSDYPGQVHGSFLLLEKLPEVVRKKMVLMHHEDDIEDHRARAEGLGFRLAIPGQVYDLETGQLVSDA